jgi:hypothetical protein
MPLIFILPVVFLAVIGILIAVLLLKRGWGKGGAPTIDNINTGGNGPSM